MTAEFLPLVALIQAGNLPGGLADTLADASRRHSADIRAALERQASQPQPGDDCPACGKGFIGIRTSRPAGRGGFVIQYLACRGCGARPDPPTRIIPATAVATRQKKARDSL